MPEKCVAPVNKKHDGEADPRGGLPRSERADSKGTSQPQNRRRSYENEEGP